MAIESAIAFFASATSSTSSWFLLVGVILGLLSISSAAIFLPSSGKKSAAAAAARSIERGNTERLQTPRDVPPPLGSSALDALGFFSTVRSKETTNAKGAQTFTKQNSTGTLFEEDRSMDYIIENNHKWREEILARDPDAFKRLAKSQSPKYLYIGCSDSRVPAQNIMGLHTGDLFVVRNVANLCVNTDHSLLAALVYAVNVLEVTDIVVCGHYGCGGVRAAMENKDHGLLEHWLLNIRNVQRLHLEELEELEDIDERHRRFVELNVQESCINLFTNPVVQRKQAKDSIPKIHGLVYDVATGLLNKLDINFKAEIFKYEGVYRMYGFQESSKGEKKDKNHHRLTPKA